MSARRFAIIDPAAGISGDMLLGALIDAGAPSAWLRGLPARLGLDNVEVEIADVMRCGLRATKVTVRVGGATEGPADVHGSGHTHGGTGHHHHHPGEPEGHHHGGRSHHHAHRHLGSLLRMIEAGELSAATKERAAAAYRLLAEAEARVHGTTVDKVGLHEVGALDALVDIVGAVEGFEQLGIDEVYTRPVAVGSGWITAAHGNLPLPAPATAILLEGIAIAPNGPVQGEATTPTGAALLKTLARPFEPGAAWSVVRTGFGAGGRNPGDYANTLRLMVAETAAAPEDVLTMVTDLDDLSPEYLEPLREALMAAGALDVVSWATQMKKGRIGFRIETLAPAERLEPVAQAFFAHSTTAAFAIGPPGVPRCHAKRGHHGTRRRPDPGQDVVPSRRPERQAGIRRYRGGGPAYGPTGA
ncbi:MAG: nickel pincer cofactor biosynthesis protein LarC [Gemmatimonadales bacterium]